MALISDDAGDHEPGDVEIGQRQFAAVSRELTSSTPPATATPKRDAELLAHRGDRRRLAGLVLVDVGEAEGVDAGEEERAQHAADAAAVHRGRYAASPA